MAYVDSSHAASVNDVESLGPGVGYAAGYASRGTEHVGRNGRWNVRGRFW